MDISVCTTKHLKSFRWLFLLSSQVTVPGQEPYLTKVIIPKKSQDFSALKKDIVFPLRGHLDSSLVSNLSCPMIPLYSILPSHSAATKPSLFLFLVTLFHILFKWSKMWNSTPSPPGIRDYSCQVTANLTPSVRQLDKLHHPSLRRQMVKSCNEKCVVITKGII